jgi:hypothetical protein
VCVDCGLAKPLTGFVRIKACHQGWYGRCRVCRNRRARERYHSSPEICAAEIARSSRNQGLRTMRKLTGSDSDVWSPLPGGFVVGLRESRRAVGLTLTELASRPGSYRCWARRPA